jgi:hypothetical protein
MDDSNKLIGRVSPLPITYTYPESQLALFANHFSVVQNEHEVILSFYQLHPPLAQNDAEAKVMLGSNQGIPAQLVARIAVPRNRMPSFIEAIVSSAPRG